MMGVLAIINQKAGVGSTTTAINLGDALARRGRRVMLLDLDPRGCLAPRLGIFRSPRQGVDRALLGEAGLSQSRISTRELLDLVPAGARLKEIEQLEGGIERARLLQQALTREFSAVDHVLIDCPPSGGLLAMNALFAADTVLIPVTGRHLSMSDLARFTATLKKVETLRHRPLGQWLLMNRFVTRRGHFHECLQQVRRHFPDALLETVISEASVLEECSEVGRTLFEYRPRSRSASEFLALAEALESGILSPGGRPIGDAA